jgi:type III restriction enzyme
VIETLHYHCFKEPHYIQEIKSALTEIGIIPEKVVQRELFVKEEVRKRWQDDVIFINKRIPNPKTDIKSFKDAKIKLIYSFQLNTGEIRQELLLENNQINNETHVNRQRFTEKLIDIIDENIIRNAIDRLEFYRFNNLKKNYPHLKSIKEFIISPQYLGGIEVEVLAPQNKISNDGKKLNIDYYDKLKISLYVLAEIEKQTKLNVSEFKGSDEFDSRPLWEVFRKKTLKIDKEELERKELQTIYLHDANWFAQVYIGENKETAFYYGTKEEQSFLNFFSKFVQELQAKYQDIVLLRNEKFFQIFDFDEGRPFEPDFVLLLKRSGTKFTIYQIFIEPKGEIFAKAEPWKEEFLVQIQKRAKIQEDLIIKMENKDFRLIGLPFYSEGLEKKFEDELRNIL